jgi:molybdopterin synthase sulfur carrier subunit
MNRNAQKVKVQLFANIVDVFEVKEKEFELEEAPNIGRLLESLCSTREQHRAIFDSPGKVRSDLKILKNGRQIQFLDGLQTKLAGGDIVSVLPPVYGG